MYIHKHIPEQTAFEQADSFSHVLLKKTKLFMV
jgi:hypothetical protein